MTDSVSIFSEEDTQSHSGINKLVRWWYSPIVTTHGSPKHNDKDNE